jgi:hypothetical protein
MNEPLIPHWSDPPLWALVKSPSEGHDDAAY